MTEEELAKLAEGLASVQSRLDTRDAKDESDRKSSNRKAMMDKFGSMFSNDEEIGDLVEFGLNDAGSSVETATVDAVRELILEPLSKQLNGMIGKIVKKVEDTVEKEIDGPAPGEQLDLNNPETLPEMAPPVPPPSDTGSMPPSPDMGTVSPPDTGGMPPPPDLGTAPPPSPDMVAPPSPITSDERFKNIRPIVLSDERFKTLELSDQRIKALEQLSAIPEVSDADMKDIVFYSPGTGDEVSDKRLKDMTTDQIRGYLAERNAESSNKKPAIQQKKEPLSDEEAEKKAQAADPNAPPNISDEEAEKKAKESDINVKDINGDEDAKAYLALLNKEPGSENITLDDLTGDIGPDVEDLPSEFLKKVLADPKAKAYIIKQGFVEGGAPSEDFDFSSLAGKDSSIDELMKGIEDGSSKNVNRSLKGLPI